jgi:hypothetical protein
MRIAGRPAPHVAARPAERARYLSLAAGVPAMSLLHKSSVRPISSRPASAPARRVSRAALGLCAALALPGLALANKIGTYTSTSNCNSTNTGWTVTNTCTCTTTIGDNPPHQIQSGSQYVTPVPGLIPTATITDPNGNPIIVNGAILSLVYSPAVTAKVTMERGVISPAHQWAGFESNVMIDPSNQNGFSSAVYVVTFSWPVPVGPDGAVWCSNNSDDLYGHTVYDGFGFIPGNSGAPLCAGDGSGTACPCGNNGAAFNGCASSVNPMGAHLGALGNPSVSADTYQLIGTGMPDAPCLYFQGTGLIAGGSGAVFGDGLRCVGGTVVRLGIKTNVTSFSSYPQAMDLSISAAGSVQAGQVRNYQCWYRNGQPFCTPDTWNLTNAHQVTWTN